MAIRVLDEGLAPFALTWKGRRGGSHGSAHAAGTWGLGLGPAS